MTLCRLALVAGLVLVSPFASAKEVKVQVKVKGWASAACVCATENALQAVKGVKSAKGDLKKGVVAIDYDDAAVQLFALEDAIRKAGYEPASSAAK